MNLYLCGFITEYKENGEDEALFLAVTFLKVPKDEDDMQIVVDEVNKEGYNVKECYAIYDSDLKTIYGKDLNSQDISNAFDWIENNRDIQISKYHK